MTPEFQELLNKIYYRHENGEGWTEIANSFNSPRITRGHIYKMVDKLWEPNDPDIRFALGLPALVSIPACPICGEAHTRAHHEQTYDPATSALYNPAAQVVKSKPKPRKLSAPKIAIRKDDMDKAAQTIINNLGHTKAFELMTILEWILKEQE